ncbi:uncharacterized protein LOC130770259 isoform X2 [Actinidia eriantha]|uniref:uncharacterized protein LOC130770259 isoform X2 n=1 Tax=Actinidia eriantha TaxID=165200 RepID=UPI00258F3167|nr:uncharacterized protein LOC130770259 isoform X2 [Actinidia eriantha]
MPMFLFLEREEEEENVPSVKKENNLQMAPRGRPRKRRLMRMDAAVDHMGLYGFPEELVRGSVKNLLKEYGGDDGWPFIEENGYMVLLNDILKEQDERIAGENSNEEENLLLQLMLGPRVLFVYLYALGLQIMPHRLWKQSI